LTTLQSLKVTTFFETQCSTTVTLLQLLQLLLLFLLLQSVGYDNKQWGVQSMLSMAQDAPSVK